MCTIAGCLHAGQILPVFLSDNHAETFGWITRTFDPDESYQLVLVDAHSDASAAERSEEIRDGIRRVASESHRAQRVESWRTSGRIQAFNWIEPLMPRPIERVLWLPPAGGTGSEHRGAIGALDGRLEVEPRSVGSLANRWHTLDFAGLKKPQRHNLPIILTIDLDFFADMSPEKRNAAFGQIWEQAVSWPTLAGVGFSVSRPWLRDDAEADTLLRLACDAVARTRGARLEMDISLDDRPDTTKMAGELRAAGGLVPRWDAISASAPLKARWKEMGGRIRFESRIAGRVSQFESELEKSPLGSIHPDSGEVDCDGVWRFPSGQAPDLRIDPPPGATGRVRWYVLEPVRVAWDLLPLTGLGKGFSKLPGRWIYEKLRSLGSTGDFALAARNWRPDTPGRVRITAEYETPEGWMPVPAIDIRLCEGTGFHAALSECFRMPYVFGIAGISENHHSGVEAGWGSDCSNLLIHAWRRNGLALSWGDPGRLRKQLDTKAEGLTADSRIPITATELERGLMIDFGRHVAAVWDDLEPVGELGSEDRVLHHLGGFPEVITLETLAQNRPPFALRMPFRSEKVCRVKIAGDVVLASDARWEHSGFKKGDTDLFLANLEGVPSLRNPKHTPQFDFRFPPDRLAWLKNRGIDAVSLANNHAMDAGHDGLTEGLLSLKNSGIGTFGAGSNADAACRPWITSSSEIPIAVFGVFLTNSPAADPNQPCVAGLPEHAELLDREIRAARADGAQVIVMVHGGDEYRSKVNPNQRKWARWLMVRGARLIAGSGPHVVQRTETHAGATIMHSLGNAVYPKELKGADSGEIRTIELGADGNIHQFKAP